MRIKCAADFTFKYSSISVGKKKIVNIFSKYCLTRVFYKIRFINSTLDNIHSVGTLSFE